MADVYKKLLLSSGGGIISETQQAAQTKNTATVLIGLGGTGIDCLRCIKTQVFERLKPDNPDAVVKEYSHIRFIGVDTTRKTKGDEDNEDKNEAMALHSTEFFDITNPQIADLITNPRLIEQHPELSWLNQKIDARQMGANGAGGVRQVGRCLLMSRSNDFRQKVLQAVNEAKQDLQQPAVFIHIFAGLSGGTGSGTFLDACYIVKDIARQVGGDIHVMGYFFLPDVNLSRIPLAAGAVREYIPKNGYAAMQELDYCMSLQYNGGTFSQQYANGVKLDWKEKPVDMAHLICATDKDGNVIRNAYDYAMNVTAEYIMDFLTEPEDKKFGLDEQLSNYNTIYNQTLQKSVNGTNPCYCVIGASCASVPMREINTYLAAEMMHIFSETTAPNRVPTRTDTEELAVAALGRGGIKNVDEIYESLQREITEGGEDGYEAYPDDYKFVEQNGNQDMTSWYRNQKSQKLSRVEMNGKALAEEGNEKALITRIVTELNKVIRDLKRGPRFAYGMIDAANAHNLIEIIDGLIETNKTRKDEEAGQSGIRREDYENSKYDFENAGFLTKKKKFESYDYYLAELVRNEQRLEVYDYLGKALESLRKQLQEKTRTYYLVFRRVTDTLFNTFLQNKSILALPKKADENFQLPLLTVDEIRPTLDKRIEEITNPAGVFENFMNRFIDNAEAWINEDENKITALVTRFFTDETFSDYAERTIDSFLMSKYQTANLETVTQKIYADWMVKLAQKSAPLFYSRWGILGSEKAFVSVPQISQSVKDAAHRLYDSNSLWEVKNSALTDRIYIMHSSWAIPIGDYRNLTEYETNLFNSNLENGRHYYEGNPIEDQKFSDWNELAPLTPASLVEQIQAAPQMLTLLKKGADRFDRAYEAGIIKDNGDIYTVSVEKAKELFDLLGQADSITVTKETEIPAAEEWLDKTKALLSEIAVPSGLTVQRDGIAELKTRLIILKDRFIAAPALQIAALDNEKKLTEVTTEAEKGIHIVAGKIAALQEKSKLMPAYFDALFTGVIAQKGKRLVYNSGEAFAEDIEFSALDDCFPFGDTVPMYQGYLTYQKASDELKAMISKEAKRRKNDEDPAIKEAAPGLKVELSPERVSARIGLIAGKAEEQAIRDFMRDIVRQYQSFSVLNDL